MKRPKRPVPFGPLRALTLRRRRHGSARRGRRHPPGAHAGAVGAARRLHCAARAGVAPQNSLRELRSLRSDTRGESVHEARATHASPPKSPPAGTACRSGTTAARVLRRPPSVLQSRVRPGSGALRRRREAQGLRPRAQRASITDSPRVIERSERSSRSEFCGGPQARASQGSLRAAQAAEAGRRCPGACGFAAPPVAGSRGPKPTPAMGGTRLRFMSRTH
jgi:hypothetical protein